MTALAADPLAQTPCHVNVPCSVPWTGVQAALNTVMPNPLAQIDENQTLLGGVLKLRIRGQVTQIAELTLHPEADGLKLSVPIQATFKVTALGLESDVQGKATLTIKAKPFVTPDWQAGATLSGDFAWLEPLQLSLGKSPKLDIAKLVDAQLRAQLKTVLSQMEQTITDSLKLHERAEPWWEQAHQAISLPKIEGAYLQLRPQSLSISPFIFTPEDLQVTLGATFFAELGLGRSPQISATPLPKLTAAVLEPACNLNVVAQLPYPELSKILTDFVADQSITLDIPTNPTIQLKAIEMAATNEKLNLQGKVILNSLGRFSTPLTLKLSGQPSLTNSVLGWQDLQVNIERNHATAFLLGAIADNKLESVIRQYSTIDLAPYLQQAAEALQQQLPFSPHPAVTLAGQVAQLRISDLKIQPQQLRLNLSAAGQIGVTLLIDQVLPVN